MTTETINGLHSCKPGNDPVIGQVKLFVIEHRQGKSGKPYIKIKSANAENGGTPHRILGAEKTDFVDKYGNNSYNLEVEQSTSPPSTVQNLRSTMQQGEIRDQGEHFRDEIEPESPVRVQQGEDGVNATRKHLMQSSNLYVLCIKAVNNVIAGNLPEVAQTSEQFQAAVSTLFIEASSRRTSDGVNWWSYVDRMPTSLIPNGKHSATSKPIQKEENKDVPF